MARKNYIHQLQDLAIDLANTIGSASAELTDLVCYLNSDKFHVDTTVQVDDVLRRLQELKSRLTVTTTL